MRVHFGLGKVAAIDRVEVRWPCGEREVFTGLDADRLHKLVEGSGKKVNEATGIVHSGSAMLGRRRLE